MNDYKEYKVKVYSDKTEWYNLKGELHREGAPAIEHADGYKSWYINGKPHNEKGPALEGFNGYKAWYLNGIFYSEINWKKEVEKLKNKSQSCDGKVVIVDGKEYTLQEIK